jgi:rhombotail lipoprotein
MALPGVVRAAVLAAALLLTGCASQQRNIHSSAVEYLYSGGYEGTPATLVKLTAPVHVGIAFAPTGNARDAGFSEESKQQLLQRIADAFRSRPKIGAIEIIPSNYLNPGGGFVELDRLQVAFRVTEIVLISYEQIQFSDTGAMGLTYWAYGAPAYFVKGEKNETRTFLDAAVIDIPTRAMLFHAAGESSIKGSSTLVGVNKALRERSQIGFAEAVDQLIVNLDSQITNFEATLRDGTIEVPATPKIPAWTPNPGPVAAPAPVQSGAGTSDAVLGVLLLGLLGARRRYFV